MEPITYNELKSIFKRVAMNVGFTEEWFDSLVPSHGLPFMVRYIAAEAWLRQIPENEDTKTFREQVAHLNDKGHWNVIKGI